MIDQQDDKTPPYYRIGSLEKGLQTLEALVAHGTLTVLEASKILGFNRSATHRFLATLKDLGYVMQEGARYRATLRVHSLGLAVAERLESRTAAHEMMVELNARFNETVNLGCLEGNEVVVLDMIKSHNPLKYDLPIGSRGVAHATGLGKAILAFSSDETVKACWQASTPQLQKTANTITSFDRLSSELADIRRQGYAVDEEEWVEGIRCIAVPILDFAASPVYAISVSGPTIRMNKTVLLDMQRHLLRAKSALSALLGFQGHDGD